MLDLNFVCDNLETVEANCRNRGVAVELNQLLSLRDQRSKLIVEGDNLRRDQKEISSQIPKTKDADEKQKLIARGKELREAIAANEKQVADVEPQLREVLVGIPNMTHPDAPVGQEADSKVLRIVGEIKKYSLCIFKPDT